MSVQVPVPAPVGPRGRLRRLVAQWPSLLVFGVLWMFLWGDVAWGTFAAGVLIGTVVVLVLPLPTVGVRMTLRPWRTAQLMAHFLADLFTASFQIAWLALRPGALPRGGVIEVPLHPAPDLLFTLTAELCSLVPGTLVVETDTEHAELYVHVLDIDREGGVEAVREHMLTLQERVLLAFAVAEDLPDGLRGKAGGRSAAVAPSITSGGGSSRQGGEGT